MESDTSAERAAADHAHLIRADFGIGLEAQLEALNNRIDVLETEVASLKSHPGLSSWVRRGVGAVRRRVRSQQG